MPSTDHIGQNGWCDTHRDRGDHTLTARCTSPVTETEHNRQLAADAEAHDRHVRYSPEAAYVAQHRPY